MKILQRNWTGIFRHYFSPKEKKGEDAELIIENHNKRIVI
jgi:hypothetical protein